MSFARNNTEPCTLACEFLETVRESAREGLSGKNAEVFLTEIGVSFHTYVEKYTADRMLIAYNQLTT
jgi:hypothetical protein